MNRYSDTVAQNEREWVRDIWNVWFDEAFPPTPSPERTSPNLTAFIQITSQYVPVAAAGFNAGDDDDTK